MEAELEVKHKDLLARIGVLHVGGKKVETPAFVPVINPVAQVIPAKEMKQRFGAKVVITNAYILLKRFRDEVVSRGVHDFIGFDDVVMTDSGGYQVLMYGDIEASPSDIATFQEVIGSDIAVPLDRPTGLVKRKQAEKTVEETLQNVLMTVKAVSGKSVWVAPVQGGLFEDLVEKCIREYERIGFSLYCLGSPTPLMTSYRYKELAWMIIATRKYLGHVKPLHLFGAGHPMVFALVVALGVDLFDSASYALFAKEDRYMTRDGTVRVDKLNYLPCSCTVCVSWSAKELRDANREERFRLLALHNLHVCFEEVKTVKQAVWEGRLFELLERRARSHPAVFEAFRYVLENEYVVREMMKHTPLSKRRGLFLLDQLSLKRPEFVRVVEMVERWRPSFRGAAVLMSSRAVSTRNLSNTLNIVASATGEENFEVFIHDTPFGLVPLTLYHVFPISQTNFPPSLLKELENTIFEKAAERIQKFGFSKVYVFDWGADVYPGYSRDLSQYLQTRFSMPVTYIKPKKRLNTSETKHIGDGDGPVV